MQPVETEAYSLNSVLGIAGGVALGVIFGPMTNHHAARMVRVAGFAAIRRCGPVPALRPGSTRRARPPTSA